jgi:hypothetical protein
MAICRPFTTTRFYGWTALWKSLKVCIGFIPQRQHHKTMKMILIIYLLLAACPFVMESLTHAPFRNQHVACLVADKRLRDRFVSEDELYLICNTLMPACCRLKPSIFERAFSGIDGVTSKPYRFFLTNDDDFNVVDVGERAVFAVKKYRVDNVMLCT